VKEYETRLQQGEQLLILDDMVLDVTGFIDSHPGGREMIDDNIGRDVSKYFYGAYSMAGKKSYTWTHSREASSVAITEL
jgi:cytochrome b involved in lipid metabolism